MFVASVSVMVLGIAITLWARVTGRQDRWWVRPSLAGFTLVAALLQDSLYGRVALGALGFVFVIGAATHYRSRTA